MISPAPRSVYTARLAERNEWLKGFESRRGHLGYSRLLAMIWVGVAIWLSARAQVPWWGVGFPLAVFVGLVWWQSRIERDAERLRRAIRFQEAGIARIENRRQGSGETGERFLDPHHPYAADLDLFGRASLFELLSTARTRGGEARLASWLQAPAAFEQLHERHAAVDELRPMLDLREQLAVPGDDFSNRRGPGAAGEMGRCARASFSKTNPSDRIPAGDRGGSRSDLVVCHRFRGDRSAARRCRDDLHRRLVLPCGAAADAEDRRGSRAAGARSGSAGGNREDARRRAVSSAPDGTVARGNRSGSIRAKTR